MNSSALQSRFAHGVRTGAFGSDALGNRATEYRRLVRGIFDDTLRRAYPLTVSLLTPGEWDSLISGFLAEHSSMSPLLWRMPKGLFSYVQAAREDLVKRHPALLDLMRFEWLEIELYMMPDEPRPATNGQSSRLIVNPELRLERFSFPVFRVSPNELGVAPIGEYFLAMFRHPETSRVHVLELSPFLAAVLHTISEKPLSAEDAVRSIFDEQDLTDEHLRSLSSFIDAGLTHGLFLGYE